MPPIKYRLWAALDSVGAGAMQSSFVALHGIAKGNTADIPHAVANEYVCGQLGRAACLPIPPAAIVDKEGEPFHVSVDFNLSGDKLPPIDPATVATELPTLSCGIILFDVWIVNDDRHAQNLSYNAATGQLHLFDHSHAPFRTADPLARLQQLSNQLAIGGHCLPPFLTTIDGMKEWSDRLNAIPEFYITDALFSATKVGMPVEFVEPCRTFLLERRTRLLELIVANKGTFPKVPADSWNTLETLSKEAAQ